MAYYIQGKIQHYAWGGYDYLPRLLHIKNDSHAPFAEYWLGAHPKAPSEVWQKPKDKKALDQLISENPELYLGKKAAQQFGRLPYLFKVLDVKDMLSIQVHPSKKEAEKGFAKENESGIPKDAPTRNYKDDNHKPEMMVALSEFYLLHGFREQAALEKQLKETPELNALLPLFQKEGYRSLYSKVMNLPQDEVNQQLSPLLKRILPLYKEGKIEKTNPDFWAARALVSGMTSMDQLDRGLFSLYFLNLLRLVPGESTFQAAGLPHAYLEGQNIELMANSDNVLRGGLTQKHVDVPELLKHIRFEGKPPTILKPQSEANRISYPSPVPDFSLEQIILEAGQNMAFNAQSLEIGLLLQGAVHLNSEEELYLKKGDAFLAAAGEKISLNAREKTIIFKAATV